MVCSRSILASMLSTRRLTLLTDASEAEEVGGLARRFLRRMSLAAGSAVEEKDKSLDCLCRWRLKIRLSVKPWVDLRKWDLGILLSMGIILVPGTITQQPPGP